MGICELRTANTIWEVDLLVDETELCEFDHKYFLLNIIDFEN